MATEHIYTVSSLDVEADGYNFCVAGSYRTAERAVEECVNYILERLDIRDDIMWSFANDENHPEAAKFFDEDAEGGIIPGGTALKDEAGLREHLRNELGLQRCYYVFDGNFTYRFDIDENDIED